MTPFSCTVFRALSHVRNDPSCLKDNNLSLFSALVKFPRLHRGFGAKRLVQATTVIVETVIVESTVLVEQKPLTTTQFYLLQTTILVETTVIVEQKTLTVFSTITVVACTTNLIQFFLVFGCFLWD